MEGKGYGLRQGAFINPRANVGVVFMNKAGTTLDTACPLSDMRKQNSSMELPEEKAIRKLELEKQRAVFVDIILVTDAWLKMFSSVPAHSYRGHEVDMGSFIEQGRNVQAQCSVLVRRIDNLRGYGMDNLVEEIDGCWNERNKLGEICNAWRERVDQVLSRIDSVLAGPPQGNA